MTIDKIAFEKILKKNFPHELTLGQEELMGKLSSFIFSTDQQIFVLNGYAGTGKTSVVISLTKTLPTIKAHCILLAPTGRAAKVLSNYSRAKAHTVHRYIYLYLTSSDGITKIIMQKNKLKDTLFVVDEASMIQANPSSDEASVFSSRNILQDLMDFVFEGENCKLLLIGDKAQLPPVGTDISLALDEKYLNTSFNQDVKHFELTDVVRQQELSGVLMNATWLRQQIKTKKIRFPFFNIAPFKDIVRISGMELEEELNNNISYHGLGNVCIICRSNKRANLFNQEVRKRILGKENEISAGDFLMVVKNNYFWLKPESSAGFIANGDIAEILRIGKYYNIYGYRFADVTIRLVDYPDENPIDVKIMLDTIMLESSCLPYDQNKLFFEEIMKDYDDIASRRKKIDNVKVSPFFNALQVKFAYSFTCHKTQGGQWDTIFIDQGYLTKEMVNIEYLRWLYTALTRAISKVYFVNFNDYFFKN